MGSRRRAALALLAQAAVAGLGAAAFAAWRAGLPATAAAAALAAAWTALAVALSTSRERVRVIETPRPRGVEHEARELRLLLDHTPAPLVTRDPEGVLRAVNRAARALFGVDDRILSAPRLQAALAEPQAGRGATLELGDGPAARIYALSVAEISGARGVSRLAALVDIGGELRAAEAAALREMLQVLSHELMNSLTPITSLAETAHELLADGDPRGREPGLDALRTIARRADGIGGFVRAYRDLARLPDPVLRPVDLAEVLEEAARLVRARWEPAGVTLDLRPASRPINFTARADVQQLLQALLNLLANAAEAVVGGADPGVRLSLHEAGGAAVISVEDGGPGIDPAHETELFRPFFTTKAGGSGVGLSLARSIARAHGGDLVLARNGQGAAFELTLPLLMERTSG